MVGSVASKASVVELVRFRSRPDVDAEEVVSKSAAADGVLSTMSGFVSRYLTQSADGEWTDIVLWSDMESASSAAEQVLKDAICLEFFSLIDQDTIDMQHLRISSSAP